MTVLFSSDRPLGRADNVKAVWDAYDGEKEFIQRIPKACQALSPKYSVFVVDCTPQHSPTKGDVKTVFVSHGITGDKLYALDFSEVHHPGCSQVDWAICTDTEYGQRRTASQFGLPSERVLRYGLPVTDGYVGKRKGDGGTPLAKARRAYLYVPTWRPPNNPPLPRIDWARLDAMMADDEVLVVKRHMCTGGRIADDLAHVREVDNMEPSVPWLIDCDVVATDFSSILFDGYILGKPSVLVTDGHADYMKVHGMYEPYPDFYGSRTVRAEYNEVGLLAALREAFGKPLGEVERNCVETVAGKCDGHAAERVAGLIKELEDG